MSSEENARRLGYGEYEDAGETLEGFFEKCEIDDMED